MLRYHQAILDHLALEPQVSEANARGLAEREKKCRLSWPAAVREWYSLERGASLLDEYNNSDRGSHAVPVEKLGDERYDERGEIDPEGPYVCFFTAGEAGDPIFFKLGADESEDPPVFALDTDDDPWFAWKPSFSRFVHDWITQVDLES